MSYTEYEPKYKLNDKIIYDATPFYINGIKCASSSHPNCEVIYDLSTMKNHPSTTNKAAKGNIQEGLLRPFTDDLWDKIKAAKEILQVVT